MVQVVLQMTARPQRVRQMLQALRSLMLPLEAARGFVSCRLYVDAASPNSLCYIEQWHTREDLDALIRSSHYTRLLALMEEAAERPDLRFHWIREVKGLEYLEAVRLCKG